MLVGFSKQLSELSLFINDNYNKNILKFLIENLVLATDNGDSCLDLKNFNYQTNDVITDCSAINFEALNINLINSGICNIITSISHNYDCNYINSNIKPLTLLNINNNSLLYFTRYFYYEQQIIQKLFNHNIHKPQAHNDSINYLNLLINNITETEFPNLAQINAVRNSLFSYVNFITGGPGTGKTTTVLLLIIVLIRNHLLNLKLHNNEHDIDLLTNINIAIIAPTGKAVNRLKQTISGSLLVLRHKFNISDEELKFITNIKYSTIHGILISQEHSIYFKHNRDNWLPYNILIIDESSMISLALFYKLISAIKDGTHVIFLGDKDQLSSVEEGYVFASLVKTSNIKYITISNLTVSNRNNLAIGKLAKAINSANIIELKALLTHSLNNINNQEHQAIRLMDNNYLALLNHIIHQDNYFFDYIRYIDTKYQQLQNIADCLLLNSNNNDIIENNLAMKDSLVQMFIQLQKFTILCALNLGNWGVDNINKQMELILKSYFNIDHNVVWYHGKIILIVENNKNLTLYNGDLGVCLIDNNNNIKIIFENNLVLSVELLPKYQVAYAITIHKAQGSEFNNIAIIVPPINDKQINILTKELLYTAVTRAKHSVTIYATEAALIAAITRSNIRQSGINILTLN